MAQILAPNGRVAGAGFLVAEGLLVTCAHVVQAAAAGPGQTVRLAFPHLEGGRQLEGRVLNERWRAPEQDDLAVIRLRSTSAGMRPLPLGSAAGCRGHHVRSFGFPAQAPPQGHFGFGVAGDLLPTVAGEGPHLQLTLANDLTTGFSGAPVLDEVTGLVIGMLTEIAAPDAYGRGQGIAYVTPTQVLRETLPELAVQDLCPYRGLEPFTAEQARWFEGRKDAIRQVVANLARQRRLTLLLGPSGSGKSSLIQAGVLGALAAGELPGSDRWLPVLLRPRRDLLAEIERAGLPGATTYGIAAAVSRKLAAEPTYERILLIIDQFEELLTEPGQHDRLAAAEEIATAVDSSAELSVILVMRDDFYPQLAALTPQLLETAMPGLLNVPATLSQQDLHDIITLPAQDVGLHFQPGLPEQIVTDVLVPSPEAAAGRQASVTMLPLLELTLSQLWARRRDGYLTHDAYRRIGAVSGSLTNWCDTALNELGLEQRPIAREILTSLVHPADPARNVPAVRAQVPLHELHDMAADPDDASSGKTVNDVLAALTHHRIITTQTLHAPERPDAPIGQPVAELIHDALIRDWGTLREWVSQDRRFQGWLNRTRDRYARWAATSDPGDLLGGTALAEGLEWSRKRRLPGDLAAFLTVSKQRQQAVIRRSRRINVILATVLALALVAAAGALWQWRTAEAERQAGLSRQLAAESNTLIDKSPDLASLLAIYAYRASHTPEAAASLQDAAALPLHRRLVGHKGEVYSVAFSPDRHTLATASTDHTVRLWDVAAGKTRTVLTGHKGAVWSVAFSPDGRTLATGSTDHTVRLWDMMTGKTRSILTGHANWVSWATFSPDGRTLATASKDRTARLWDVATGKIRTIITGHADWVYSVAFSPDGRTLATASKDRTARLWDVTNGKMRTILSAHTDAVWAVKFSPDGRTLATSSSDGTARLWDVATGKARKTLVGHTDQAWAVAFSPDGRTLATGSADQTARLWDVATGNARASFAGHTGAVEAVAFSRDGRTLATASDDRTARLWDVATGNARASFAGHTGAVEAVVFSPDGRTLASGSDDRTARLWDPKTGKTRFVLTGHTDAVWAVRFTPDGHTLATASSDKTVRLWDVATGKPRSTLTGHKAAVTSVAFSPDGRTLATCGNDETVRLWDLSTGHIRTTLVVSHGAGFSASSVAFSPDGRILAIGSSDNTVQLRDVATEKPRSTLAGHADAVTSLAFSPDGHTLATGSNDKTARLWDVATGKPRSTLTGHADAVTSVAFGPDGHTLATGSKDKTARLWDVATGRALATFAGHADWVWSVAFSPDKRTLATGSSDQTARLWDSVLPEPDAAIRIICRNVNRDLSADERTAFLPGQSAGRACPSG
ncbi:trypsin-like peptidase domain-containing protein [Streptomyces sp. ISL-94]|uniref:nSTAND1 domain-containing NTPase n=1 Tax=Streptomyces sp. ISL-94 TaxID=2819190 RepID=UPI001BE5DC3A|nr:trypsin-like peptidase domain-containing protein [Streptomyces sp. ISL-94]MBT2478279.1 trypsin-like peptidase domain-containing protein [Streptomyces sp. ISL-94]